MTGFNLNVVIHCFGTMLKDEGLEKRVGLGLARSRSHLMAKIRRLGLVSEGLVYIPDCDSDSVVFPTPTC